MTQEISYQKSEFFRQRFVEFSMELKFGLNTEKPPVKSPEIFQVFQFLTFAAAFLKSGGEG
jgi:hypothetical protein